MLGFYVQPRVRCPRVDAGWPMVCHDGSTTSRLSPPMSQAQLIGVRGLSRLTTGHPSFGVKMRTLPCRYFFSKGELHREDGRLSFYRELFGEPKLEDSWDDGEWRALRLHRSFFELELHLLLRSGDTKQFELSITEAEAIAWAAAVGLTIQTEDAPEGATAAASWSPLPETPAAAMPAPLLPDAEPTLDAELLPEPEPTPDAELSPELELPPEGSIERVLREAVAPEPETLFESVTPAARLVAPSALSLEGLAELELLEASSPAPVLTETGLEPPAVLPSTSPSPRRHQRQEQGLIKRLLPTPGHWLTLLFLFFMFPVAALFYLGFRYRKSSAKSY